MSPRNDRKTPALKSVMNRSKPRYMPTAAIRRSPPRGRPDNVHKPDPAIDRRNHDKTKTSRASCCGAAALSFLRRKGGIAATDHELTQAPDKRSAPLSRNPGPVSMLAMLPHASDRM